MSQPETIALTYDPGTGSVTKTYGRFKPEIGRTVYREEDATLVMRDELVFYRTEAKRNGAFLGMAKSAVKLTIDVPATDAEGNSVNEAIIVSINTSVYPSIPAATVVDAIHRIAKFIISDEGIDLVTKLEI